MERIDAISDQFRFDPKVGRYRWRKGTPGAGQLVAQKTIETMLEKQVTRLGDDLVNTSALLSSGMSGPPLRVWQGEAGRILKKLHGSIAVLAHGGQQNMSDDDWLRVGRALRQEYTSGTYTNPETGKTKRYGLKLLAQQLKAGGVSIPQLRNRLRMYANNARKTYWSGREAVEKAAGKLYGYRETTPGEICPDCVRLAGLGVQRLEDMIMPGERSRCGPNCRCRVHYLTEAEAVKRGYVVGR